MDTYANAQWSDASQTALAVDWTTTVGGAPLTQRITANAIRGLIHYEAILAQALSIAAAPLLTVDQMVDAVQFKIAFNHENRIRAIEGKAQITAAQFKAALLVLLS